ncbi:hypothetical protein [Robertmurraya sp. Marseille-Q9965]
MGLRAKKSGKWQELTAKNGFACQEKREMAGADRQNGFARQDEEERAVVDRQIEFARQVVEKGN